MADGRMFSFTVNGIVHKRQTGNTMQHGERQFNPEASSREIQGEVHRSIVHLQTTGEESGARENEVEQRVHAFNKIASPEAERLPGDTEIGETGRGLSDDGLHAQGQSNRQSTGTSGSNSVPDGRNIAESAPVINPPTRRNRQRDPGRAAAHKNRVSKTRRQQASRRAPSAARGAGSLQALRQL